MTPYTMHSNATASFRLASLFSVLWLNLSSAFLCSIEFSQRSRHELSVHSPYSKVSGVPEPSPTAVSLKQPWSKISQLPLPDLPIQAREEGSSKKDPIVLRPNSQTSLTMPSSLFYGDRVLPIDPAKSTEDSPQSSISSSVITENLMDQVKAIAASTAAMTVASLHQQQVSHQLLEQTGRIPTERLATFEKRLESLERKIEDSEKQNHDIHQFEKQLSDLHEDLQEFQDYDTVTINWSISQFFDRVKPTRTKLTSDYFKVADCPMMLEMHVNESEDEDYSRSVGFYIMQHSSGRKSLIKLGGTTMKVGDKERVFSDSATIDYPKNHGWGWQEAITLQELLDNFLTEKGDLDVSFKVRVKRLQSYDVDVAMISE